MIYLPICYAAPIAYYHYLVNYPCQIEMYASYRRQTYANRCYIATSNGIETLTIPVEKTTNKTLIKDVKISNSTKWQSIHYKSLESAYNSSPFFDFFNYKIFDLYSKRYTFLIDFNIALQEKIVELLNYQKLNISYSTEYIKEIAFNNLDLRQDFNSKTPFIYNREIIEKPYYQVFSDKFGFVSNLSIFDLIFNLAHESRIYLKY